MKSPRPGLGGGVGLSTGEDRDCRLPPALAAAKRPERIVGRGFRCWMAAYLSPDGVCCRNALHLYASDLGDQAAKAIMPELCVWVHAIHAAAAREIEIYPPACAGFCRDECLAISMIAASQCDSSSSVRACAFALTGVGTIDDVVETAGRFGRALHRSGIVFGDASIALAVTSVGPRSLPGGSVKM